MALRQRAKSLGAKGNCGCFSMFLLDVYKRQKYGQTLTVTTG